MARRRLPLFALVLGACAAPSDVIGPAPSVLRVSTSRGLEPISPSVTSGATRNLIDLVYDLGEEHFTAVEKAGTSWLLVARQRSEAQPLAATVRHPRLVSATDRNGNVEVVLRGDETPSLDEFHLDIGPFLQESYSPEKLVLRRRGPTKPQWIEFIAVATEDEEWRRFLGREVDLNPLLTARAVSHVREVPSVRVVAYRERRPIALIFGAESPVFDDVAVRRGVASRLVRPAIAKFATGDPANAIATRVLLNEVPLTGTVRLIFHDAALDQRRAVLVVEQQLVEMGFDVQVAAMEFSALLETLQTGRYDAFVFASGHDPKYAAMLTTNHDNNISRYSNPAFDEAVKRGDMEVARAILEDDVPLTPLYVEAEYVAVDRRFCNVRPVAAYDYEYLAYVRGCEPGETE